MTILHSAGVQWHTLSWCICSARPSQAMALRLALFQRRHMLLRADCTVRIRCFRQPSAWKIFYVLKSSSMRSVQLQRKKP